MKKINLLILLLLIVFCLTNLNAKEKIYLTTFKNSGMGHVQQQILKELYTRLGYDLEIVELPGRRAIMMSNSGESDGEVARVPMVRQKFKNLMMIPIPLHNIKFALFVTEDKKHIKINNYDELMKYDVVTMRGYIIIEKLFKERNKELKVLNTYKQILLTLKSHRADVALLTYLDALNSLKFHNIKGLKLLKPFVGEMPVYHFVHKKNKHLIPKLTKMLEKMEEEGRLKEIENEVIKKLE